MTAGGAAVAKTVKGIVCGGRHVVSWQSCRLTAPRMSPAPDSSGARQTTLPECSSITSPFQAGTSSTVRVWGSASGTKAPLIFRGESAASVIFVAIGPPRFWEIA